MPTDAETCSFYPGFSGKDFHFEISFILKTFLAQAIFPFIQSMSEPAIHFKTPSHIAYPAIYFKTMPKPKEIVSLHGATAGCDFSILWKP
jgi:hypothetical protein